MFSLQHLSAAIYCYIVLQVDLRLDLDGIVDPTQPVFVFFTSVGIAWHLAGSTDGHLLASLRNSDLPAKASLQS